MSNLSVRIDKGEGVGLGRVINFGVRGCLGRGDVVYFRSALIVEKVRRIIMTERLDTTFDTEAGVFNFRVGGIIISGGKVLMVYNGKHKKDGEYYSVGGRCKMNEGTEHAVERECFEETGVKFKAERLGFIHENFFIADGKKYHEISFYYYMKPLGGIENIGKNAVDLSVNERLVWVDIDKIGELKNFYPDFFRTELLKDSREIGHFVTKEY